MLTILTLQTSAWLIAGVVALVALGVQRVRRRPRKPEVSRRGSAAPGLSATELGWVDARRLARELMVNVLPPARDLWAVVPAPGEIAYLELPVLYSRYCSWRGASPGYQPSRQVFYGGGVSPGVAFLAVVNAIDESVQYRRDRELATPKWRGHEHTRVVLTSHRLLVLASLPENRPEWVTLNNADIREFCPELERGRLEVRFYGRVSPLRLEGPATPIIAAWLGWALYGADGMRHHPGLRRLFA